jgi:hypothetical protein
MNRQLTIMNTTISFLSLVFFLLAISACGSNADLAKQISGKWRSDQGTGTVSIKLDQDPKSIIFDGHAYQATVEEINKGAYLVKVNVTSENGQTEAWTFRQLWDDNGSTFNLAFGHNGATDKLVPGDPS